MVFFSSAHLFLFGLFSDLTAPVLGVPFLGAHDSSLGGSRTQHHEDASSTYYDLLGVAPNADTAAIRQQYKKMALRYHPDRNRDKPAEAQVQAEATFKKIANAYEVLSDEAERRKYDDRLIRRRGRDHGLFQTGAGARASPARAKQQKSGARSSGAQSSGRSTGGGTSSSSGVRRTRTTNVRTECVNTNVRTECVNGRTVRVKDIDTFENGQHVKRVRTEEQQCSDGRGWGRAVRSTSELIHHANGQIEIRKTQEKRAGAEERWRVVSQCSENHSKTTPETTPETTPKTTPDGAGKTCRRLEIAAVSAAVAVCAVSAAVLFIPPREGNSRRGGCVIA